jgi:hypothetical protein
MPVSYFSQSAAHTSCMLSLQGVLLCLAALCQLETETPFTPAVLAGHHKCSGGQYTSVARYTLLGLAELKVS